MRVIDAAITLGVCVAGATSKQCLKLPSDPDWPNQTTWSQLNSTVGGRLSATVPLGSVCHEPTYDAVACADLQAAWTVPGTQFVFPSYFSSSFFYLVLLRVWRY